ncbi:glycosyltransferase [Streptosporangium sp. NPDC002721]|uniref:glycosyltransferase n=1 Tax=Streptosporangium sp. NPDC002721 TaxID=3366188 RepID=UPI0036A3B0C6
MTEPYPNPDTTPDAGGEADLGMDYVLPLRWSDDAGLGELTAYLRRLRPHVRVIVVDGSPAALFARHAARWNGLVTHVRPDGDLGFANGKVNGVVTGLRRARAEHVIIADDDVRYDAGQLARVDALLEDADLVRPQNHFDPMPWHARWDTARTLLNRGLGADYPGTFGVRRSTFRAMGGYDGDVLFENLELIRTVRAHGGREDRRLDLYVRRLPPDPRRFWSQRVRQAYDDLAQPARMAFFLALGPAVVLALLRRRPGPVLAGAGLAVGLAEIGRRRAGGRRIFPRTGALFAPVWMLERAVCSWLALGTRILRGGVFYAGCRIPVAAHPARHLRARSQAAASDPPEAARSGSPATGEAASSPIAVREAPSSPPGTARGSGSPATGEAASGPPAARKPERLCEPSQNGLDADRPQRHSATVARPGSMTTPS